MTSIKEKAVLDILIVRKRDEHRHHMLFQKGKFSNKIDILSHKHSKALTGNGFEFPSCERGLLSRLTIFH